MMCKIQRFGASVRLISVTSYIILTFDRVKSKEAERYQEQSEEREKLRVEVLKHLKEKGIKLDLVKVGQDDLTLAPWFKERYPHMMVPRR